MMTSDVRRRSFFAIFAALLASFVALFTRGLSRKEAVVIEALNTDEGRRRLAAAMAKPLRCGGLDYDANGRPFYRHERRAT